MPLQELHHGDVVVEGGRGTDDLVEVGGVGGHLFQSLVELLSGAKIVERKDDGSMGAKFSQLRRSHAAGGLEFNVEELASGVCGFVQDFDFGGDGAFELTAAGDAAAGGDGDHM